MEQPRTGCMGMSIQFGATRKLCPPLQRLKEEHRPLAEQMNQCAGMAKELLRFTESLAGPQLQELYERTSSFHANLDAHSRREEDWLFPLMAKHIGNEMGPIAVMEQEHDLAKEHLKLFLQEGDKIDQADYVQQTTALNHLLTAIEILIHHFYKEENVLFPMAEQILSGQEKGELQEMFQD